MTKDELLSTVGAMTSPASHSNGSSLKLFKVPQTSGSSKRKTRAGFTISKKFLPEVRNQWSCGSCYIFSALYAVEGTNMAQGGSSFVLSPQTVLDCCDVMGCTAGCSGGTPEGVLDFLKTTPANLETDYAYVNKKNRSCRKRPGVLKVSETVGIQVLRDGSRKILNDQPSLFYFLEHVGPLTVLMCATDKLHFYHKGIAPSTTTSDCPEVNHAVAVIGYELDEDGKLILYVCIFSAIACALFNCLYLLVVVNSRIKPLLKSFIICNKIK